MYSYPTAGSKPSKDIAKKCFVLRRGADLYKHIAHSPFIYWHQKKNDRTGTKAEDNNLTGLVMIDSGEAFYIDFFRRIVQNK